MLPTLCKKRNEWEKDKKWEEDVEKSLLTLEYIAYTSVSCVF